MDDLRKAAMMALEVMEHNRANGTPNMGAAIEALRQALAQPEGDELEQAIKKGTKAWAGVDSTKWVDELRGSAEQEPEWLEDGFGTMWKKCGKKDCGKFVVKIGKVDCWNGDCPEAGVKK